MPSMSNQTKHSGQKRARSISPPKKKTLSEVIIENQRAPIQEYLKSIDEVIDSGIGQQELDAGLYRASNDCGYPLDVVKHLIAKGACVGEGETGAVFAAVSYENPDTLAYLWQHVPEKSKFSVGGSALMEALMVEAYQCARFLAKNTDTNYVDDSGATPLHTVCKWGEEDIFDVMLSKATNVDAMDENGITPLMEVTYCCYGPRGLLSQGASVNSRNANEDCSFLSHFFHHDSNTNADLLQLFLDHGADVQSIFDQGCPDDTDIREVLAREGAAAETHSCEGREEMDGDDEETDAIDDESDS